MGLPQKELEELIKAAQDLLVKSTEFRDALNKTWIAIKNKKDFTVEEQKQVADWHNKIQEVLKLTADIIQNEFDIISDTGTDNPRWSRK